MSAAAQSETKMPSDSNFVLRAALIREFDAVALFAGLAGGLAEVMWIGTYSLATGRNGFEIARHVADAVFPGVLSTPVAPALGLGVHFGLSALLGLVLARLLTSVGALRFGVLLPICIGALGLIWAVNFILVLPLLDPIFPSLLPAWVTLMSKLLFGAALAGVLCQKSAKAA